MPRHPASQPTVRQIVSGGQTGVDRGALDAAIALGITHGGWCPAGRRAEGGPIPAHYTLQETTATDYAVRTQQNVIDSDATLILCRGRLSGGTGLTRRLARRHARPLLVVDLDDPPPNATVIGWLDAHRVRKLNVAGPRERTRPGIAAATEAYLRQLLHCC